MPLTPIPTSTDSVAEKAAQQIYQQITTLNAQVVALRANGIPAKAAAAARTLPNGQIVPAQPATPGCAGADIDAKLGPQNVAILDALSVALNGPSASASATP